MYTGHVKPALQTNWCHQLKVPRVSSNRKGETGKEKEKAKSIAIARHAGAEGRTDSGYWVKNVLFYHMFTELLQSFPYTLMQHPNNSVLERGDRAEQLFSNFTVLALFTEIL